MQVLLQGVQDAVNVIQSGQLAFMVSTPGVAILCWFSWLLKVVHVWQMHNEQGCKFDKPLQSCNVTTNAMQSSDLHRIEWHASTRNHKKYKALTFMCSVLKPP